MDELLRNIYKKKNRFYSILFFDKNFPQLLHYIATVRVSNFNSIGFSCKTSTCKFLTSTVFATGLCTDALDVTGFV